MKKFEQPEIQVMDVSTSDVITTSVKTDEDEGTII